MSESYVYWEIKEEISNVNEDILIQIDAIVKFLGNETIYVDKVRYAVKRV